MYTYTPKCVQVQGALITYHVDLYV